MSFIQGTSIFELRSSLQLSSFVELLLEPISKYEQIYLIKLGLHEALVNAVKHGNNLDPSKIIRVKRIITPKWCVWQIEDQGKGLPNENRKFSLPKKIDSKSIIDASFSGPIGGVIFGVLIVITSGDLPPPN